MNEAKVNLMLHERKKKQHKSVPKCILHIFGLTQCVFQRFRVVCISLKLRVSVALFFVVDWD